MEPRHTLQVRTLCLGVSLWYACPQNAFLSSPLPSLDQNWLRTIIVFGMGEERSDLECYRLIRYSALPRELWTLISVMPSERTLTGAEFVALTFSYMWSVSTIFRVYQTVALLPFLMTSPSPTTTSWITTSESANCSTQMSRSKVASKQRKDWLTQIFPK